MNTFLCNSKFLTKLIFGFVIYLISNYNFAATNDPQIAFPDWRLRQVMEQKGNLQKEAGNLSQDEIKQSEKRGLEAFHKKQWAQAASEYSRIVGSNVDHREAWLKLSLALQHRSKEEDSWKIQEASKLSAINLILVSKTPEDKAEALLIYGNNFNVDDMSETPSYMEVYEVAQSLTDIAKLKESRPDVAGMMTFRFQSTQVNNQSSPPSVCFSFSHPIATQNINHADFFKISPKVDGALKVNNRDLCLSPVKFGVTYDVILKAGLKDIYGEKTPADIKLSFKVKDQPSLLSFKTKAYVLRKEEKALIPLSGVNVDAVNLKILRINDRSLNQTVGQSNDFLTRIWEYSVEQIENTRGELLYQGSMDFSQSKNETITRLIPFSEVVKKTEPGVYVIQAEEKGSVIGNKAIATQWVIVSDFGITSFSQSDGGIWVNVRSLQTALPLAGVEVKLLAYNNTVLKSLTSNKDGMVFFGPAVTKGKGGNRPLLVLAYGPKEDFSFLALDQPAFDLSDRGVSGRNLPGALDAFLYTEQGVYRPGDTVHVNTLLRDEKANAKGGLPLTFKVFRSDDVLVSEQTITGNALGFYEVQVPLQGSSRTGNWSVAAYLDPKKDAIGRVQFSVEDFVPSRITVKLSSAATELKLKESIPVDIMAKYLFGAPAAGLSGEGSLTLRARPNPFPKWPGYRFGLITDQFKDSKTLLTVNPLDKEGKGSVGVELDRLPETTLPLEAVIHLSLSDNGGRPEMGSLTLPLATSEAKIGIKASFVANGNSLVLPDTENNAVFEVITINEQQQQEAISNLEYELFEERPQYTWYQPDRYSPWQYQIRLDDKFLSRGTLSTHKDRVEKLSIALENWGQYRLEIRDPKTKIASSIRFNKGYEASADSAETPDKITLRVNQDRIQPKGTVELYIESPFEGQALLTIANHKILETRNMTVSPKGTRVKLAANEDWGVGVYCLVSAFRPITETNIETDPKNPARAKTDDKSFLPKRAIGLAWVGIDAAARTLNVNFDLPAEAKPRQTVEIPFVVSLNGKPITSNTQIAIAAVDEGILKLTDFLTPKPQDYFFGKHRLSVELRDLYGKLIDPMPGVLGELRVGGDGGLLSRNLQALSKRSFKVVSLYQGLVELDKEGKGRLQLQLPDFNGSLRLMAVAFNEKSLGSKEATVLVRDPIVVEGVMPRFLAPQDKSQLALSLHNVQAAAGQYHLEYTAKGPLTLDPEKSSQEISLEKNEAKDLEIPIHAEAIGDASITVKLTGQGIDIQREFEISIRPLQPYQLRSHTAVLKAGEETRLDEAWLKDYVPETIQAALSWSTSVPWDTQAIFKGLSDYPYGCVEQSTSKAIGALYSGASSRLKSATEQDANKSDKANNDGLNIKKDRYVLDQVIAGLSERQASSGSYALWTVAEDSGDIFLTAYVMDFLWRTREQGIPIPKYTLERGLDWLSRVIDRREYDGYTLTETTYALYLLTKADRIETGALRYFYDTFAKDMRNPIARAFMGTALAKRGDLARAKEAYHNIMDLTDKSYDSPYGTFLRDKLILVSLMRETLEAAPSLNQLTDHVNALLPAIQKQIQPATQRANLSTQELAWAVIAANSMEPSKPEQSNVPNIDISVGGVESSSSESNYHLPVSMIDLHNGLTIKNKGKNTLWQNLLLSGIPKEAPKAESAGIEIERQYYNLQGEKLSANEVKQGTQMVVVITGQIQDELPHQLLVVDFLPAGFEIENARLGQNGVTETFSWLETPTTAEYTELRDDRYVASLLLEGQSKDFRLAYIVRAVTPGTYHSPGLYVEDMYAPTYFARTDAESVQVTAR